MKKLKLSSLQISAKDLLTREQMKAVHGGSGDGASGGSGLKCKTDKCGQKYEGGLIVGSGKWVDVFCKELPRAGSIPPSCGCEVVTQVNCNA